MSYVFFWIQSAALMQKVFLQTWQAAIRIRMTELQSFRRQAPHTDQLTEHKKMICREYVSDNIFPAVFVRLAVYVTDGCFRLPWPNCVEEFSI